MFVGKYEVIGTTLDDALGEALDKAARLVGLMPSSPPPTPLPPLPSQPPPVPLSQPFFAGGGAALEVMAQQGEVQASQRLPVPLLRRNCCDFSYSGLKNAFRMMVERVVPLPLPPSSSEEKDVRSQEKVTADLCASFQEAAFQHVEDRYH